MLHTLGDLLFDGAFIDVQLRGDVALGEPFTAGQQEDGPIFLWEIS